MPIMNGYEATRLIREMDKKILIIAMTANAFSEDIQHSLEAGMNAHVSKPVDMKVLKKTIFDLKNKYVIINLRNMRLKFSLES